MAVCVTRAYEHYVARIGKPPGPMLRDYDVEVREHEAYVLEQDGAIIGVLVLVQDDAGMLLDNVAVLPDLQGQGHGKCLISHAEDRARAAGFEEITLYTHETMTENVALYQRLGYIELDRRTEEGYRRVFMRKAPL